MADDKAVGDMSESFTSYLFDTPGYVVGVGLGGFSGALLPWDIWVAWLSALVAVSGFVVGYHNFKKLDGGE